jgi:hypothetical protein
MGQRAGRRAAFDVALIVEPEFEKDFRRVLDNKGEPRRRAARFRAEPTEDCRGCAAREL